MTTQFIHTHKTSKHELKGLPYRSIPNPKDYHSSRFLNPFNFRNPLNKWLPVKHILNSNVCSDMRNKMYVVNRIDELISHIKTAYITTDFTDEIIDAHDKVAKELQGFKDEMDEKHASIKKMVKKAFKQLGYLSDDDLGRTLTMMFPKYFANLVFKYKRNPYTFDAHLRYFLVNEDETLLHTHIETIPVLDELINLHTPKLVVMVGLAGAGKTDISQGYLEEAKENGQEAVVLSSDAIREEKGFDGADRSKNAETFSIMNERTIEYLNKGVNVIYDATNIVRSNRMKLIEEMPKHALKIAVYLATPYETVIKQNLEREHPIPEYVIDSMYKRLEIPIKEEGWDKVVFEHHEDTVELELHKQFTDAVRAEVLFNRSGYELLEFLPSMFIEFDRILESPQDTPEHNLSMSRHAYYTYRSILETYKTEDETSLEREAMLWATLCLNLGKPFAKNYIKHDGQVSKFAMYRGYENVSSQIVIPFLHVMNFDEDFVLEVAKLVHFYQFVKRYNNGRNAQLKRLVGEEFFEKLMLLRKASRKNKVVRAERPKHTPKIETKG